MKDRWLLVAGIAVAVIVCAAAAWFPRPAPTPPPKFYISGVIVDEAGEPLPRCLLEHFTGQEIAIWTRDDGTFRWPFPVLENREYHVGASCAGIGVASDMVSSLETWTFASSRNRTPSSSSFEDDALKRKPDARETASPCTPHRQRGAHRSHIGTQCQNCAVRNGSSPPAAGSRRKVAHEY